MYNLTLERKREIRSIMSDKNAKLLAAATRVFMRYGFSKTTMGDVAQEAGVSRQTLYNAYPGKDEVLRAAVRSNIEVTIDQVAAAWGSTDDLGQAMEVFFEHGPLAWYDILENSPDAADLFEGLHSVAKEEVSLASARWVEMFEGLLLKHAPDLRNASQVAEFMYSTSINSKYGAETRQILVDRLSVLKSAILLMVKTDS